MIRNVDGIMRRSVGLLEGVWIIRRIWGLLKGRRDDQQECGIIRIIPDGMIR
jgi:hypothetical protein